MSHHEGMQRRGKGGRGDALGSEVELEEMREKVAPEESRQRQRRLLGRHSDDRRGNHWRIVNDIIVVNVIRRKNGNIRSVRGRATGERLGGLRVRGEHCNLRHVMSVDIMLNKSIIVISDVIEGLWLRWREGEVVLTAASHGHLHGGLPQVDGGTSDRGLSFALLSTLLRHCNTTQSIMTESNNVELLRVSTLRLGRSFS